MFDFLTQTGNLYHPMTPCNYRLWDFVHREPQTNNCISRFVSLFAKLIPNSPLDCLRLKFLG